MPLAGLAVGDLTGGVYRFLKCMRCGKVTYIRRGRKIVAPVLDDDTADVATVEHAAPS